MDIKKLADRYVEILAENSKRSVSAIKTATGRLSVEDKVVSQALEGMRKTLTDAASRPFDSDRQTLKEAGIGVVEIKRDGWKGCLKGYTVVSDLRGEDPDEFSDGLVMTKGGKRYFACCMDRFDFTKTSSGSDDAIHTFIEDFTGAVTVARAAAAAGAGVNVRDSFVCFHSRGYSGHIVFEGKPGMKTWHEFMSEGLEDKNIYSSKNRATVSRRSKSIFAIAKKKMEIFHANGILFSFYRAQWFAPETILVDFGGPGVKRPTDIFPINFAASAMAVDAVDKAKAADIAIVERLNEDWRAVRDRVAALNDLAAVKLREEKFFS